MKRRSFFAGIAGVISAVVVGSKVKAEKPKFKINDVSHLDDMFVRDPNGWVLRDIPVTTINPPIFVRGFIAANPITDLKSHPEDATKILQFISSSDFEMTGIVDIPNGVSIVGKSQFDSCSIHLTATSAKYNKSTRQGWASFDVKSPKVVEFIQGLGYQFQ